MSSTESVSPTANSAGDQRSSSTESETSLNRQILALAVPALATLLAEPAFLLADSAIIGHLGSAELAGVSLAATILATAMWPFVFLAYATTGIVSRGKGADELGPALRHGIDGIWLGATLGGLTALLLAILGPVALLGFSATDAVRGHALMFLFFSLPGVPALLMIYALTGILRGLQDTRTPLAGAVLAGLVNIPLNVLLVYGLGWSVAGSAVGTSLVQWGLVAFLARPVLRAARQHHVPLWRHWRGLLGVGRAGTPLLIRSIALRLVLLLTTWSAARLGTDATAAHAVAMTIWVSLSFLIDALAIAAQALIGSFLGGARPDQARAAMRRCLLWGVGSATVLGLALFWARHLVAAAFGGNPDMRELLATALIVVALAQPLAAVAFVLDGVLMGAGDDRFLAWSALAQAGVLIAVLWATQSWQADPTSGLVTIWLALALAHTGSRTLMLSLRARGSAWQVVGTAKADARKPSTP